MSYGKTTSSQSAYWVFDLDGTLVDSHTVYFDSLQLVLEQHGSNLTEEDRREVIRIPVRERALFFRKKLGDQRAPDAIRMFDLRLLDDHSKVKPFEGIQTVLEKLKARDVKLAIWTAREMDSALEVLNHTGLNPYFSFHMSGTCVSNCKPDPEGLIRIAKQFGCTPTEISMVGDHDNDMLAAKACGARAVRVLWNNPESNVQCPVSDLQFRKVESFLEWLD